MVRIFLKIVVLLYSAVFFLPLTLAARVVRPAPNFTWYNITDSHAPTSLANLNRQSAILIITPDVKNFDFGTQLREIESAYQSLAASKTLAFVAFSQRLARIPSNVPFVIVANGSQVASAYGVSPNKFAIAIIGQDGNLDYFTNKVVSGQRIMNIINNSFVVQTALRRD